MKQLNVNVTPEFERDLRKVMKDRGIKRKSDALRTLAREAAEKIERRKNYDFSELIGAALGGRENPNPKFKTEDDLWS
jgi:hypothetical protein